MRLRLIAVVSLLLMAVSLTGQRHGVRALASSPASAQAASSGFGDAAAATHEAHFSAAVATPASLVASPWQQLEFHARLILADVARPAADRVLLPLDRSTAHPDAPPHFLNDSLRI